MDGGTYPDYTGMALYWPLRYTGHPSDLSEQLTREFLPNQGVVGWVSCLRALAQGWAVVAGELG